MGQSAFLSAFTSKQHHQDDADVPYLSVWKWGSLPLSRTLSPPPPPPPPVINISHQSAICKSYPISYPVYLVAPVVYYITSEHLQAHLTVAHHSPASAASSNNSILLYFVILSWACADSVCSKCTYCTVHSTPYLDQLIIIISSHQLNEYFFN